MLPASQKKRVFIQTFGCQMNEYDTDKMLEVLQKENFHSTSTSEKADLILLNTCSIREKAEQKVYSLLGRLRTLKQKNPHLVIGVGGCVAQQEGEHILKREPTVDLVFGTDNWFDLPEMLAQVQQGQRIVRTERKAYRQKVRNFIPKQTFGKGEKPQKIKAHLAITKGCNNFCSFCIVPTTRGLEVSREPEDIAIEAKRLVGEGIKEICLLGQNVNSYQANGFNFVALLRQLDQIEGLARIRFTSPHPKDLQEELAEAFAMLPTLCKHLHLPLQSGSSRILRKMRRWYTIEKYLEKVEMLRSYVPKIALSTDLIVGFPGETEEDFQQTLQALEQVRYDSIFAFKYSPRPGTLAATMPDQLEEEIKATRLQKLLETQAKITADKNQELLGSQQEILVEGPYIRDPECLHGRSQGNHSVAIRKTQAAIGTLLNVHITGTRTHLLEAEAIT